MTRMFLVLLASSLVSWSACASELNKLQRSDELAELIIPQPFDGNQEVQEAFALWTELSAEGNADAKYYLSVLYNRGMGGIEKDFSLSYQYLAEAADAGHSTAQFWLAYSYEAGAITNLKTLEALPVDHAKALSLYVAAAEAGNQNAVQKLIGVYSLGELSQPPDPVQVEKWSAVRDAIVDCTRTTQVDCGDR